MSAKGIARRQALLAEVVDALQQAGAWPATIAAAGTAAELEGKPSLLVGVRGQTWLVNVAPDRVPTEEQVRWARRWPGGDVLTISTAAEALAAFGLLPADQRERDGTSRSPSASQPNRAA